MAYSFHPTAVVGGDPESRDHKGHGIKPVLGNGAKIGAFVTVDAGTVQATTIGRGTWLAERVAVLRGSSIGRCCIVGANSVVRGELPDYSIAVGAPARVVGEVSGVNADDPPYKEKLW